MGSTLGNLVTSALPTRHESRALLRLALPIVAVQVGLMLMGVVDTVMVGHLSAQALAAVAIGNLVWFGSVVIGMGTLMGLDPIVAQAVGARDEKGVAQGVQRGLVLAFALSIPPALALFATAPALRFAAQPADVIPLAASYTAWTAPSILPFYLFVVLRQSLQALHRTRPILLSIILANLLNAGLNWVLIYGKLGFPALGVTGAAISTTIGRWFMPVMLLAFAWRDLRPALRPWRPDAIHLAPLGRMLLIGLPIGAMTFLEYTAFGAVGLLMGRMGTVPVAAHQVAINIASLTFMVPLGVGQAAAVLVGHAVGAEDLPHARRAARAALVYGVGFMAFTAMLFLLVPGRLAAIYTSDVAAATLAAALIPVAGVFQLFDGMQAVAAGVLRGAGDTRVPLLINLGGFWVAGIPLSLALGFNAGLGPVGLWWGLAAGLAVVALVLVLRVRALLSKPITRVMVEHAKEQMAMES